MNKNKIVTSGLVLAGTSLASIVGQASTGVSAEDRFFGKVKNFLLYGDTNIPSSTKNEEVLQKKRFRILKFKNYSLETNKLLKLILSQNISFLLKSTLFSAT